MLILPGQDVRRGRLESSRGNSQRDRCHAHLKMRQDHLHHSLETAAFTSQPPYLFQFNVFEFHRRAGVSCQAQALKGLSDGKALRALGDEIKVQVGRPGGARLARRNHVAVCFAGARHKALASRQTQAMTVPPHLADRHIEVPARACLAECQRRQVFAARYGREQALLQRGAASGGDHRRPAVVHEHHHGR